MAEVVNPSDVNPEEWPATATAFEIDRTLELLHQQISNLQYGISRSPDVIPMKLGENEFRLANGLAVLTAIVRCIHKKQNNL